MKAGKLKKDSINIITLGCSKNIADSEVLAAQLQANGKQVLHESNTLNHNIVIVNTCGFIEQAKEESIQAILEQAELKQKGAIEKLYVSGCLSERYRHQLQTEIPEVDAWFGNFELPFMLHQLQADYKKELLGERLLATPAHYAYLKISEGCNRKCTFCAIPLMRGKHISKPIEHILSEAKLLVQKGVKEIMLIAQELTYYGLDLYKKRMLPELLKKLSAIEGIDWIRLHYAYPNQFPLEIIDVMREHSNICNYLDMPLQHASNAMLKAMKRQSTREEIEILLNTIREKNPEICLRTTFIVGFPGETEKDIETLKQFIQQQQFDRIGIFTYSHEEDTTAFSLPDTIPFEEKQKRAEYIMELQQEISYKKNVQKIGKCFRVIIDKKEAGRYIGRTEYDCVEVDNEVIIHSEKELTPGSFATVKITAAYDYDIEGEIVE